MFKPFDFADHARAAKQARLSKRAKGAARKAADMEPGRDAKRAAIRAARLAKAETRTISARF